MSFASHPGVPRTKTKKSPGHPLASYRMEPSSLPIPPKSFSVGRLYAEAGSHLIGGVIASIGIRDKPVYLPQANSYLGLLDWVSGQPIIFYDVDAEDRRAWLTDGASALLHLVRASIKQDEQNPVYQPTWIFNGLLKGDLNHQGGTAAAIEALRDADNLNRTLYIDDVRLNNGKEEEVRSSSVTEYTRYYIISKSSLTTRRR